MSMTRNEFKQEAAIRCLQGLLVNKQIVGGNIDRLSYRDLADEAVAYADALTVAYGDSDPGAFYEG